MNPRSYKEAFMGGVALHLASTVAFILQVVDINCGLFVILTHHNTQPCKIPSAGQARAAFLWHLDTSPVSLPSDQHREISLALVFHRTPDNQLHTWKLEETRSPFGHTQQLCPVLTSAKQLSQVLTCNSCQHFLAFLQHVHIEHLVIKPPNALEGHVKAFTL